MLRAVRAVQVLAALLLIGGGAFVASFFATTSPGAHKNPQGELAPTASGAFTIVTLSDLKSRSGVLLAAYEAAKGADALVIGGDLVQQDSDFEYRYAMRLLSLAPRDLPLFVTLGNHEAWDRENHQSTARYEQFFGPPQSWFETKGVLFVSLDTAGYSFDESKAKQASEILEAHRGSARFCVLLSHILPRAGTPLVGGRSHEKGLPAPDSERIFALVDRFSVDLLLGGHFHGFDVSQHGRATTLLTGGGGATLDDPQAGYHYLRVTLDEKGVHHEKIAVDSPHGAEWIVYKLLAHAWIPLAVVAGLLVAATVGGRALARRASP